MTSGEKLNEILDRGFKISDQRKELFIKNGFNELDNKRLLPKEDQLKIIELDKQSDAILVEIKTLFEERKTKIYGKDNI